MNMENNRAPRRKPRGSFRRGRKDASFQGERSEKIEELLSRIKTELMDSIEPIVIPELNAFERKLIHNQFDHNPEVVTKTYRIDENSYELRVYPVGNLKRFVQVKADEAISTREKVILPPMSSYERFVVHDCLKGIQTVKTNSYGEGEDRHIEIEPDVFGRGLKRIIRKIKLF